MSTYFAWGFDHTTRTQEYSTGVSFQPPEALRVSLFPGCSRWWRMRDPDEF